MGLIPRSWEQLGYDTASGTVRPFLTNIRAIQNSHPLDPWNHLKPEV